MTAPKHISAQDARRMLAKPAKKGRFPVASVADRTVDGIVFDSRIEAFRYAELKILQHLKIIWGLTCHLPLGVMIDGNPYCTYTPDFFYMTADGPVYEECKSSGTKKDAAYRLRRKAAELYHGIKITEVVR